MAEPDFAGYATKSGIKCSDGRTILAHAFKGMDGQTVPLVWQHQHDTPDNVLGHVILHAVDDGVRAEGFFNDTSNGQHAKTLVKHKDIKALSIYANQLAQKGLDVVHGIIREVSLVLAGANPGATIDDFGMAHADDDSLLEAIIFSGEELEEIKEPALAHASKTIDPPKQVGGNKGPMPPPSSEAAKEGQTVNDHDGDDLPDDASVEDVIASLTPQQKNVMYALVGAAAAQDGIEDGTDNIEHDQKGDAPVTRNVFDQTNEDKKSPTTVLAHSDVQGIFAAAKKGGSLKQAVEEYALAHGIDSIDTLFPFDQAVTDTPEFITRRMEWVAGVLGSTRKTPFSRIRSWTADLTLDEARAKGYVKGDLKKEQYFAVAKRVTTPQTIYKKQKLDRDDILDITEFSVVSWLQTELRIMLDEELARAILVGDGRDVDDADKISATNVRPIVGDDSLYVTTIQVDLTDASSSADEIVDANVNGMRYYRGSGTPVLYTTQPYLAKMLLAKDTLGRRLYPTTAELASALGVKDVIPCEALEATDDLIGIVVNLSDYTVGADKGGEVNMFDFFDIDYNQFKYLMETRVSGAMTKYRGALVLMEFTGAGGLLANPTPPSFVSSTGVGTIPTTSHVTYVTVATDGTESSALTAGAQTAISAGATVHYRAKPASTYGFSDDQNEDWFFTRTA